jgi:hypothetical protein
VFCSRRRSAHAVRSSRNGGRGCSRRGCREAPGDPVAVGIALFTDMQRRARAAFLPQVQDDRPALTARIVSARERWLDRLDPTMPATTECRRFRVTSGGRAGTCRPARLFGGAPRSAGWCRREEREVAGSRDSEQPSSNGSVDDALERTNAPEALAEGNSQQEREQDLHPGKRDAQFAQELGEVPVQALDVALPRLRALDILRVTLVIHASVAGRRGAAIRARAAGSPAPSGSGSISPEAAIPRARKLRSPPSPCL